MYSDPVNWVYSGQTFGTFGRAEEPDVLGIADGDWW